MPYFGGTSWYACQIGSVFILKEEICDEWARIGNAVKEYTRAKLAGPKTRVPVIVDECR
jgi:uncharacterized protein (DUF736 family)